MNQVPRRPFYPTSEKAAVPFLAACAWPVAHPAALSGPGAASGKLESQEVHVRLQIGTPIEADHRKPGPAQVPAFCFDPKQEINRDFLDETNCYVLWACNIAKRAPPLL
jgi:hypothetical protein